MLKTKILVIQHHYLDPDNNQQITVTIEVPKEGANYESSLYCCNNCNELFALTDETLLYSEKSFADLIKGKNCPTCQALLSESLVKVKKHINPEINLNKSMKKIDENAGYLVHIECYSLD